MNETMKQFGKEWLWDVNLNVTPISALNNFDLCFVRKVIVIDQRRCYVTY